jgi:hypothetical protein
MEPSRDWRVTNSYFDRVTDVRDRLWDVLGEVPAVGIMGALSSLLLAVALVCLILDVVCIAYQRAALEDSGASRRSRGGCSSPALRTHGNHREDSSPRAVSESRRMTSSGSWERCR